MESFCVSVLRWKYRNADFWVSKNFNWNWNILKHFTMSKQQAVTRKLFGSSPDKSLLRLQNKSFLTEIYRDIQTFAFQVLQKCSSWMSRNRAVQAIFLTSTRNIFAGKFVKWVRFLAALREYILNNVERVEVCKMSESFRANLYFKLVSEWNKQNEWSFLLVFVGFATSC